MAVKKTTSVGESSTVEKTATRKNKPEAADPAHAAASEPMPAAVLDDALPSTRKKRASDLQAAPLESDSSLLTVKQSRKLAKECEKDLKKELQRYRATVKKASEQPGYRQILEDREKIKKAEWILDSLKHFLKDTDKKTAKSKPPVAAYYEQVAVSIEDVKIARRRLKPSAKAVVAAPVEAAPIVAEVAEPAVEKSQPAPKAAAKLRRARTTAFPAP